MTLRALIFDVDGTLADTERDGHRPAFNAAFREAGLDWHWDVALYGELLAVTGGKERIRFYAERHDPRFLAVPDADVRIRMVHAAKTRHYLERLQQGSIPLRPGVTSLLFAARDAGLRLAIATTTTPENVTALLPPELLTLFEKVGAGDTAAHKKPAPDIYLHVLAAMGLSAGECLAIEDSANGLAAARGAGLPTLIAWCDTTREQSFCGALAVLPNLQGIDVPLLRIWHEAYGADKK